MPMQKILSDIQSALRGWYTAHHRKLPWRETREPYRIWVSEVMLQQTQVSTVIPYYQKFMEVFPTAEELARSDQQQVLKMWEGLGYYARARNLHKACRIVAEKYRGQIPDDVETFLALPGVGEYIASAVLSIAFAVPLAVVDGNVKRVLSRLFLIEEPVNRPAGYKIYREPAKQLLDRNDPGNHNQAVMELGALICTPGRPACEHCPVREHCRAHKRGKTGQFPVRLKPKPVPTRKIAAGVVIKDGSLLITRRKPDGLLGGLWEFPGGGIKKGEEAGSACIREICEETGITAAVTEHLAHVRHAYTHFKIEMDVFLCEYRSGDVRLNGPVDHKWIPVKALDDHAFPRANLKFFPALKKALNSSTPRNPKPVEKG